VLGYRGLSDIQNNEERIEATAKQASDTAQQAQKLVAEANLKLQSTSAAETKFQQQVQVNEDMLSGLRAEQTRLANEQASLTLQYAELKKTSDIIGRKQTELAKNQEINASSLSNSLSLSSKIGGIISGTSNTPFITSIVVGKDSTSIKGFGFGPEAGRVFMNLGRPSVLGASYQIWSAARIQLRFQRPPFSVGARPRLFAGFLRFTWWRQQ